MSSQTHTITITGKDGTKQLFDAIKRGAEQDAAALKKMGADSAAAFKQVDASAKSSEASMKSHGQAIKEVQRGAALLGASFTLASRAALDQTRQLDAVNRLYGESADEINKMSEAIQDNTNFSNDQARQAAITGANLVSNYQLTADQIEVLIERSADLAQIHGTTLADAMTRVSGAIRGEGEAAELLGLNMSDSATAAAAAAAGLTGWTTTMTEAEKAAFRFQLVLEQTEGTQGAAAAAADTTAGSVRHLVNEAQDVAQAFAAWTGPVGEGAAVLSDYAVQIGLTVGGLSQLASGFGKLGVASKLASVAMSPAGLVGIAAAATVGIIALADAMDHDYSEAAADATAATKELGAAINELLAGGSEKGLLGQEWQTELDAALAGVMRVEDRLAEIRSAKDDAMRNPVNSQEEADAVFATIDALEKEKANLEELAATFGGTTKAADEFAATNDALTKILQNTGVGAEDALASATQLNRMWNEGQISTVTYMDAIQQTADGLSVWDEIATRSAVSTKNAGEAAKSAATDFSALDSALGNLSTTRLDPGLVEDIDTIKNLGSTDAIMALKNYSDQYKSGDLILSDYIAKVDMVADRVTKTAEATDAAAKKQAMNLSAVGDSASEMGNAVGDQIPTFELFTESIETQTARIEKLQATARSAAEALLGTASFASKIRPVDIGLRGGDKVTGQAANLQQTSTVLSGVLGTFEQLSSLGQASEQADSIAENLIGSPDDLGMIQRLVDQNRISQDEYNDAIRAGGRISKEAGAIENDLNTIRAKQLPLLAEAQVQYGNTIDEISRMGAEQQRAAIGFMDTNEAMKAQNAVAVAAAAAQTEVGSSARKSAQAIIQGATDADPVLRSMLEQMDLITVDKEGNIKINFDNADELNASTDALTESIDALTLALGGIPPNAHTDVTEDGAEDVKEKADDVTGAVNGIPPGSHTNITEDGASNVTGMADDTTRAVKDIPDTSWTNIFAADNASGVISNVSAMLDGLNGKTAYTSVVNTVTNVTNSIVNRTVNDIAGALGGAHGMLMTEPRTGMASGGVIRVNEGGPERVQLPTGDDVWLPQGAMVTPHAASMYGRKGGRGVDTRAFANYGSITVYANDPAQFANALTSGQIGASRG